MNTSQAISDIITLQTLPPQIDYIRPFEIKATEAEKFLDTLSKSEKEKAYSEIEDAVNKYNEPIKCTDGNYYSVAELDAMF